MPPEFWGLDFETSGTDAAKHAPIQVGLCSPASEVAVTTIGGHLWADPDDILGNYETARAGLRLWEWSEEAFKVHGITKADLFNAPLGYEVDDHLHGFVLDRTLTGKPKERFLVGWNVAGFDRRFLRRLPKTDALFSYRTVDLNAIVFAMSEAGVPRPTGKAWTYHSLKDAVKSHAAATIEAAGWYDSPGWHDAGYDALASLLAYRQLLDYLRPRSHNR